MSFDAMITVSLIVTSIILCVLCIYLIIMFSYKKKLKKCFFKCPALFLNKYHNWCSSFILWTFIEYFLLLVPLFTSVATVYFSVDIHNADSSRSLLAIMSILTALLPLINSKVLPKKHADGFYKGMILLESAMLRFEKNIISEKELIEVFEISEKFTNPLADIFDLELKLLTKSKK